jgi:transposase
VSQWAAELQEKSRAGLNRAGRAGRKPRLDATAIRKIEQGLKRGPEALGYATSLWTSARVAHLVETECGVRYHPGHVWRILRQLGWRRQRQAGPWSGTKRRSGNGRRSAGRQFKKPKTSGARSFLSTKAD